MRAPLAQTRQPDARCQYRTGGRLQALIFRNMAYDARGGVRLPLTVDVLGRKAADFGFQAGYLTDPIGKFRDEHLDIRQQEGFELVELQMRGEAPESVRSDITSHRLLQINDLS